jgi:hypothetical protein
VANIIHVLIAMPKRLAMKHNDGSSQNLKHGQFIAVGAGVNILLPHI